MNESFLQLLCFCFCGFSLPPIFHAIRGTMKRYKKLTSKKKRVLNSTSKKSHTSRRRKSQRMHVLEFLKSTDVNDVSRFWSVQFPTKQRGERGKFLFSWLFELSIEYANWYETFRISFTTSYDNSFLDFSGINSIELFNFKWKLFLKNMQTLSHVSTGFYFNCYTKLLWLYCAI